MKKIITALLSCLAVFYGPVSNAQNHINDLFTSLDISNSFDDPETRTQVQSMPSAQILGLSAEKRQMLYNYSDSYKISVPTKTNTLELELSPAKIVGNNFRVWNSHGEEIIVNLPVTYWGKVVGQTHSFATLTVTENEVSGVITANNTNYTLGKLETEPYHLVYATHELALDKPSICSGTVDIDLPVESNFNSSGRVSSTGQECRYVSVYFEVDYQTYLDLGSSYFNAVDYVYNIFSNVSQLYSREGVNLVLNSIKVWDTPDPYMSAPRASNALYIFDDVNFSHTGADLAHLLSTRPLGGGIAYSLNATSIFQGMKQRAVFYNCNKGYAYGVSGSLNTTVVNIPSYSWNVSVVAHEIGHNFGLPHTHNCDWPGGPLDRCIAAEGTCSPGPVAVNGGTIMSYCHLVPSIGVNFAHGFGELPAAKLRAEVAAASCLSGFVSTMPTVQSEMICGATTALLQASGCYGGQYRWYSQATGGDAIGSEETLEVSVLTSQTYYVDCSMAGLCTSQRASISVEGQDPSSVEFSAFGASACGVNLQLALVSYGCEGGTLTWFDQSEGGNVLTTGQLYITPFLLVSKHYYVGCVVGTCETASRIEVVAEIIPVCNYCIPLSLGCVTGDAITKVELKQGSETLLNNPSGCSHPGYVHYKNMIPNLTIGETFSISVSNTGHKYMGLRVWIDFNQNGAFEQSEEVVFFNANFWTNLTRSFTIPAGITAGQTRMRVRATYAVNPPICTIGLQFGETEDYTINLVSPCENEISLSHFSLASFDKESVSNVIEVEASKFNGKINASNYIHSGVNVSYHASTITLEPGFEVESGTVFLAQTGGCTF